MKDVIFPFPASTSIDHNGRGNTFAPELTKLHCDESASRRWRVEEGGIGCCTCLLPWGFWRSDYASCEMEGLFSRGMLGKKRKEKKRVYMSWSLSGQLWRAFVLNSYGSFAQTMSED